MRYEKSIKDESRFRRNIIRIASGAVVSQVILVAAMPVLTRLYAPEVFGALAVFTAMHAILTGLFTLKYDLSIILPVDDEKARDLTLLTIAVSLLFSALLFACMVVLHIAMGVVAPYYLLLPISTVLGAAYTCGQQWGARKGNYQRWVRSQVLNAAVNVAAGITLAFVASIILGTLVAAFVIGLAAGLAYLVHGWWRNRSDFRLQGRIPRLLTTAREYRHFPFFVLPSSLTMTLGASAPPFILQAIFSLPEVGHYAIANRFLLIPTGLVGGAVGEALRPELVDRINRGEEVASFVSRMAWRLVLVALPSFALLFMIAPILFEFLFGEEYQLTGFLSRYLLLGVLGQFLAQPFGYVFIVTNYVRLGLFLQTLLTILSLLGLLVGGLHGGLEQALLFSSFVTFFVSILLVFLAYRCCLLFDRGRLPGQANA